MARAVAIASFLAAAAAHADDVVVRAGASTRGAVGGGSVELSSGPLAWSARIDVAFDRGARSADRAELAAHYRGGLAGVSVAPAGVFAIAGVRLGRRALSLELGALARVAGEARFVQHARYMPGWFARAELRWSHVVVGGEVRATGLAERDGDGTLRGDAQALITIGAGVWR